VSVGVRCRTGLRVAVICGGIALSAQARAQEEIFGQLLDSEIPLESFTSAQPGVRDRPRPELQPPGMRIGDAAISLSLDSTLGSTSNVLGAQNARTADGFAEWRTQLSAVVDLGPARAVDIALDYDGKRFFQTPTKAQDGYLVRIAGHTGLGAEGMLSAGAVQQRIYEDQLAGTFPAGGGPAGVGGSVAIDWTQGQIRLADAFNRVRLTGAATADRLIYHDTINAARELLPQAARDHTAFRASSRIDYTLHENTTLFAQLSWRLTDFTDKSPLADRSAHEFRASAGISADLTGLLRLSAGLGGYVRQYGNPMFGRVTGLAWNLRGTYYVTTLNTLSLQAKREFVDANVLRSPGYQATTIRLQLDHEFLRNLLVSAAAGNERDQFALVMRRDRLRDYAVWADYWIGPQIVLRPRLEWLDRRSSGADAGPNIPEFRTQLTLSLRK
jgi:hypothetical protein